MIEEVIHLALRHRIAHLAASSFGLRSHAIPTEDHLGACVRAVATLLTQPVMQGARVVIGSSQKPEEEPPPAVTVLPPHHAAAEATRLRNVRGQAGGSTGYLIYLNTDSTPGESGLNVLEELSAEGVAEAYAASASLPLLQELAGRRARLVRKRIADASVGVLARYAALAQNHGEPHALPLLGLIPNRQGKALPGPAPARELDLLRGVKAANAIASVEERLKNIPPDQREAIERKLVSVLLSNAADRPLTVARALASKAWEFAVGASGDPGELCGLTTEFARVLRSGAQALDLPTTEPDDDREEDPEAPTGAYSDEEIADELPEALTKWQIAGELSDSKDEDPSFSLSSEGGSVTLRATTPRGLLRALFASDDRDALDRYVRCGDCFEVSDPTQLKASRRVLGVKVRCRPSGIEEEQPALTSALQDAVAGFLQARKELMASLRGCFSLEQEEADGGETVEGGGGMLMALALIDSHSLLVISRMEKHAERYVRAYEAVIAAAYPGKVDPPQRVIDWLANLDLAFATNGTSVVAARLLPLHPLRVSRALLWRRNGVEPPAFPSRLAVSYHRPETLLPDGVADVYAATHRAWPSSRGVALAVRHGVAALWALLAPRHLVSSLAVAFVDVPDVASAVDALCSEARKRFEADADVGAGVHIEVRVLFSDHARVESWREVDPSELSPTAREAWEATRGEGVSVALPRKAWPAADREWTHLAIQAVDTPFAKLAEDASAGGGGLPLRYVPGPSGNVAMIGVRDEKSLSAYDHLLDGLELAHRPSGLDPMVRSPEVGDTLVRALVARGGWPVKPSPDVSLLSYAEADGHVATVLCDGAAVAHDLEAGLKRVTTSAQGINLRLMREAVLSLYSCRSLLHELVEELDERHLRGQVGLTRAFIVARKDDHRPTLPISLDSPEGHRWARSVQRHFDVSRSRADLILAEAEGGEDEPRALRRLRVVELKTKEQARTFSTSSARAVLSEQARLAAARVRACFETSANSEPSIALQRLAWMEASRQQLALKWKAVLEDFERGLALGSCPPLIVECWIIPETPWPGEDRFEESHPRLNVKGEEIPGDMIPVRFFVMPPLEIKSPPPRGGGRGAISKPPAKSPAPVPAPTPVTSSAAQPAVPPQSAVPPAAVSQPSAHSTPTSTPPPELSAAVPPPETEGIVVRVGDVVRAANATSAIWTPNRIDRVNHYNVGITGTMGTGKTQLTKSLLAQLIRQGARNPGGRPPGVLIFDYKGDYGLSARDEFPHRVGATVLKPEDLPLNPLRPSTPESRQDLTRVVYAFADTLSAIEPRIGRVQRDEVVQAVQACLAESGIDGSDPKTFTQPFPTLRDLLDHMTRSRMAEGSPQSVLREMVDLGVFAEEDPQADIDALFDGLRVIDLKPLAGMKVTIRAIIAFFMNAFYRQMLQLPEAPLAQGAGHGKELRQLRRLILVDEADDFLSLGVESLRYTLQQGRSFGCGVILSTQFLSHFDQGGDELKASIGTWFLHQMANLDRKDLVALFGLGSRDEANALAARINDLPKHTSLCRGLSTEGYRDRLVEVRDLPFKDLKLS